MKLAIIGCGKIGEALVRGIVASTFVKPSDVYATTLTTDHASSLSRTLGVHASTDNRDAVSGADAAIIAVKPKAVPLVLEELKQDLRDSQTLVISVAAAIDTATIERQLGSTRVIRAMPNIAALVRESCTCLARGTGVGATQMALARAIFDSVGRTIEVDERLFNAVTALGASGPAFVLMAIESLAEGGVRAGLGRDTALELSAQVVVGAGKMVLELGEHPAKLKDSVTTPAGCTVDGILELEKGGLRVALIKAVSRTAQRAGRLIAADKPR